MLKQFFNKINCALVHKKSKLKVNFTKKKIEKKLKKIILIKNITQKHIELNFTKKKSINMHMLRNLKKIINVKN